MSRSIPDGFFWKRPDFADGCGDTGYYLSYRGGRDGDTLMLCHDMKPLGNYADPRCRILCFCSRSDRPLSDGERQIAGDICPDVALWAVAGRINVDAEIEGIWNTREFLTKYFEYRSNLYLNDDQKSGKVRKILVEVAFGTAWYGVNN
ncbi:hypothetical protein LZK98_07265 [Sphingomonas cannabina]|uniref:hypothetical protein n=1 Tax=Sphingomonas cannabina TaxID=2899123 RepID=UPI001F43F2C2|nr:hypothetical protein [Sphingomonas cannabina]UIJ46736.1 hypothetical protein LZK98_07265 [Sphingomonas cannabina]